MFPFALWSLWLHWNNMAFDRAHNPQNLKTEALARASEFFYLGINGKQIRTKQKIQVRWQCPPPNWFKLNTDGSSLGNPGLAGGGGLIRNEKGEWVKGFARAIGTTTSVAAELWALRDGIRLCIALKLQDVVIELDSKIVVDLLKKELNNSHDIDVLVAECRNSLRNVPLVSIQHCYREGNKCVDALARRGALLSQNFSIFLHPPSDVAFLLSLDAAGTLYDRFISSVLEAG